MNNVLIIFVSFLILLTSSPVYSDAGISKISNNTRMSTGKTSVIYKKNLQPVQKTTINEKIKKEITKKIYSGQSSIKSGLSEFIPFKQLLTRMIKALFAILLLILILFLIISFLKKLKNKQYSAIKGKEENFKTADHPQNLSQAVSGFVKQRINK